MILKTRVYFQKNEGSANKFCTAPPLSCLVLAVDLHIITLPHHIP